MKRITFLNILGLLFFGFSGCNPDVNNPPSEENTHTPADQEKKKVIETADILGVFATHSEWNNSLFIFWPDSTGEYYYRYDEPNVGADTAFFNWELDEYTGEMKWICPDPEHQFFKKTYTTTTYYSEITFEATRSATSDLILSNSTFRWYLDGLESIPIIYGRPTFTATSTFGIGTFELESYEGTFNVFTDNYDDNPLTISFDVPWLKSGDVRDMGMQTIGGKSFWRIVYSVQCEINYGEERRGTITISKSTGEIHHYTAIQEKYTTMLSLSDEFTYNGKKYNGWHLNSKSGYPACYEYIKNYDDKEIYVTSHVSWIWKSDKTVFYDMPEGDGHRWCYQFSVSSNSGYTRMTTIQFAKANGESYDLTVVQDGPLGEDPSNDTSGGSSGDSGGATDNQGGSQPSNDDTKGYTITRTSVCAIYALDNQQTGTKYSKSYYKWVSSSGRVILSSSGTNSAYWIGVASNNYETTFRGFIVSGYTYRYVDYTPVGGAWYYYFN